MIVMVVSMLMHTILSLSHYSFQSSLYIAWYLFRDALIECRVTQVKSLPIGKLEGFHYAMVGQTTKIFLREIIPCMKRERSPYQAVD